MAEKVYLATQDWVEEKLKSGAGGTDKGNTTIRIFAEFDDH